MLTPELHDAAQAFGTGRAPSTFGCLQAIDDLARSLGVSKAFHGHHHDRLDYSSHRKRLGFDAFGVGFCGVSDANGRTVRPGDFDEARAQRLTTGADNHVTNR